MAEQPHNLAQELAAVRAELEKLNNHSFFRGHRTIARMMTYAFLRGMAIGLGTALGATLLVSVAAYFLAQIDFIPIIGEWAQQIAAEIRGPE
ncbi:DUF5665 domain-containing protein [Actibacterium sp. XHP0104]|uniref:DUF5665 domain-containing protein n=1 Tax=Actibacterium sp. XHP0104 TaxID=2984335 RepID=UPI0021E9101E|nr:DUF5665 domain-containing protein [Actibacterium sp. XHP0104]MCV2881934.1 DUF5665 domain-containing protein [Actibacterium sp. XHP0104]